MQIIYHVSCIASTPELILQSKEMHALLRALSFISESV